MLRLREHLLPKARDEGKTFDDPRFFIKPINHNMGTTNWDHFNSGFLDIRDVELVPQMRHFENHLSQTTSEWQWRDSKTARSRSIGWNMSQKDPICQPKFYFETRGMKHFNNGNWQATPILAEYNRRQMGNYLIDGRAIRNLSPIKEEQLNRNLRFGGLVDVTDGNHRAKVPDYPACSMKQLVEYDYSRRPVSAQPRI